MPTVTKNPRDFLGTRAKDAHFSLSPAFVIPMREGSVLVLRLNCWNSKSISVDYRTITHVIRASFFVLIIEKLRLVVKSFNGKLRAELLNREIFTTLPEAKILR